VGLKVPQEGIRWLDVGLSLEEAARFHGHLGPFLVLGYRAGKAALSKLEPCRPDELEAKVTCPRRKPYSCFVDGVQCSTRCTLGKGNLEVFEGDGLALELRRKDVYVKVRVREEILNKALSETGLDEVLRRTPEELFELRVEKKEVRLSP